jgi:hypothetical protein
MKMGWNFVAESTGRIGWRRFDFMAQTPRTKRPPLWPREASA